MTTISTYDHPSTRTSSTRATITSCIPHPINLFDYVEPAFLALPEEQQVAFLFAAVAKYTEALSIIVRVNADPAYPNREAVLAFVTTYY
jgi:hypothetical protein